MLWPVWIDKWQYFSGGCPVSVGDVVEWALLLEDGVGHNAPRNRLVSATLSIEHREIVTPAREWPRPAHEAMAVRAGEMRAWYEAPAYRAPARETTSFEFTGLLYEDHHGASSQISRGVVRGIEVITRRFRYVDGRQELEPEAWQARPVTTSPHRLHEEFEPDGPEVDSGWRSVRPLLREDLLVQVEYGD